MSRLNFYFLWYVLITGAISDYLVGECELAPYFLAILNSSDEYKQWGKLNTRQDGTLSLGDREKNIASSHLNKRKRQYPTDHTQVSGLFCQFFLYIDFYESNLLCYQSV